MTITVELLNKKTLRLLKDLEQLQLLRLIYPPDKDVPILTDQTDAEPAPDGLEIAKEISSNVAFSFLHLEEEQVYSDNDLRVKY